MPSKKDKKEMPKPEAPPKQVEESESESEEEEKPVAPPKKANKNLRALMSDDEEEEAEEADFGDKKKKKKKSKEDGEGELSAVFGDKKKKKPKEGETDGGEPKEEKKDKEKKDKDKKDGEKKDKEKKKKEKKPVPIVCEVVEVVPVPKKDKLRLCKVRTAAEAGLLDVVTNAANVVAGKRFVIALPGVVTESGVEVKQAKVGGVESFGMFCGPQEMGWQTDLLDSQQVVMVSDATELGTPAPTCEEAVQMQRDREKAAAAEKDTKGKKGKKQSTKPEDEDLDAVLADFDKVDTKADGGAAKGKKGKKGKAAKPEEDDDFDAALNEFKEAEKPGAVEKSALAPVQETAAVEPPKEETVDAKALANRKKKDKKKGKAGGGADKDEDDDFDAALGEFKEDEEPVPQAPASASSAPKAPAAEAPAAAPAAREEEEAADEDEEGMDAKTLANRRKKDKKKAKKGAGGGEGLWGNGEPAGAQTADNGEATTEATKEASKEAPEVKPDPKKGGKKESAAVKAVRERMEMQRKLDEERRAFEEEQRRLIAEEEARMKEEEDKLEAERQRKRDARLAKIQKQKDEGTFQTKKQKEMAKRAALLREQFGFVDSQEPEEGQEAAAPAVAKRNLADMKKKKPKRGPKQDEEEAPEDKPKVDEQEAKPVVEKEAKLEPEVTKEEEEEGDDWEALEEKHADEEVEKKSNTSSDEEEEEDKEEEDDDDSDDDSGSSSSSSSSDFVGYRSPIIVIMGHVDTGKTKLLDKIRRTNVQEGEAGGITQQIGATYFPDIALMEQTKKVDPNFDLEVPGMMIIDTPGHESFNNLRMRGSSLCDMAILVIDIMHGLEPQTVESLELLKARKCPFIIALNKCDVCYQWNSKTYTPIRDALDRQEQFVREEFQQRLGNVMLQLNERGLNCALYWENDDPRSCVSIIPTSALTGEGVPDLLYQLLHLSQSLLSSKLEVQEELQCTVIEVKNIEGLGTTIDVILVNGTLREGDQIVIAGMGGAIVTTIRALLTPQPMKEMRVKNEYMHHTQISTSMGVKICAPGLDEAMAGTELFVVGPEDDVEEMKEEVSEGFESILADFEKQPEGVYVKASTLGSLEALLSFLQDMKIPVFDVGIGEVHKKDIKKAAIMKEKKRPEYAVILAFDVKVNNEAKLQAAHDDVQIMTADIIYHLKDHFTAYMEKVLESRKTETRQEAVFPVILQIDKQYVFHKNDPLVFGCNVVGGQLRLGTPMCVPEKENIIIGHVGGIERDHKPVQVARRGDVVCVKIEQNTAQTHIAYGRHFDYTNQLFSHITRSSIDTLKEHFKDEMSKSDWEMVRSMKKVFNIM